MVSLRPALIEDDDDDEVAKYAHFPPAMPTTIHDCSLLSEAIDSET